MLRLFSFVFQIITEEWVLDVVHVIGRAIVAKIYIAETLEVTASPSSVPPRAERQVKFCFRRLFADSLIESPSSIAVFRVVQTAYHQHGRF